MSAQQPDDKKVPQQAPSQNEPIRHKGQERTTPEEKHSGPQPDGNGATGKPAAFPPHN